MSAPVQPSASGPVTHYDLFAGLRDARVEYLVTGAVALVLHGVPRLTPDVDLAVDSDRANLKRLEDLCAAWGYGEAGRAAPDAAAIAVRRFRHPAAALDAIDVILPAPDQFARLLAGAASVTLVDVDIPIIGAADLGAFKRSCGSAAGREDAAGLETLASVRDGEAGGNTDTRREQIRKFSRWSVNSRLDWLLAAARLNKGLSPEARPMTRGLVRRRGWYGS